MSVVCLSIYIFIHHKHWKKLPPSSFSLSSSSYIWGFSCVHDITVYSILSILSLLGTCCSQHCTDLPSPIYLFEASNRCFWSVYWLLVIQVRQLCIYFLVLIYFWGVGKTSLLIRFHENEFVVHQKTTIGQANDNLYFVIAIDLNIIGVDYKAKEVKIEDESIKLQIWDTAGILAARNNYNYC